MDLILAFIAAILLSPIFLIIAVLVRIKLGSPVIFKQKRPGLNEKIFTLYKFRTMTDKRDKKGELLPDEIRLTSFGKFLRSSSLDELPELFNILIGNMSIVGPRPLLIEYLCFYTDKEHKRYDVRPGLTGWAQISGRNYMGWDEKFEKRAFNKESDTYFSIGKKIFNQEKYDELVNIRHKEPGFSVNTSFFPTYRK